MSTGKLDPTMPPEGEARPTLEELEILATWIDQGAVGPAGDAPMKITLRTPEVQSNKNIVDPFTAIAISDDGSKRAIGSFGRVQILASNGDLIREWKDLSGKVNSLQFNRKGDSMLVATGLTGAYGTATIYSVSDGELTQELLGHRDVMSVARYSPDESTVATAGYDRVIKLWDVATGKTLRELKGHNGAVFDVAYSPDGKVLASASGDATVKLWDVNTGDRIDTLSQNQGEVYSVEFTRDGKFIAACGADNRLRVWRLRSVNQSITNPIVVTRFVDESPLVDLAFSNNGRWAAVVSQSGRVKLLSTDSWNPTSELKAVDDTPTNVVFDPSDTFVWITLISGKVVQRELPKSNPNIVERSKEVEPIYLNLGEMVAISENDAMKNPPLRKSVEITGSISQPNETDSFRFQAKAGEVWAIDADPADKSLLDPIITIHDGRDHRVLRTRLQAMRESYFTFRGKDSSQVDDFRVFNWEDMQLNEFFYSSGEVSRLWMHPRGPDSGFKVYPGEGKRWTYFGTSAVTHSLNEPGYVVRPLSSGEQPTANGLPVFEVYYENDDDPTRQKGTASRLIFKAPRDDIYTVKIRDTRGEGGGAYQYRLQIRASEPSFNASMTKPNAVLRKGTGREFVVRVDRMDGFEGPVTFDIQNLPDGLHSNFPIVVEAGQRFAVATIWAGEQATLESKINPAISGSATILGRHVERSVGETGELKLDDRPSVIPSIHPVDHDSSEVEDWTVKVRRGETVSARVKLRRIEGFNQEVSFGKEDSGRNTSHGVYVDNIGLNGLLVLSGENEREFFLTADPSATPGRRTFFLTAAVDGGVTTHPITVEVLP